MFYFFSFPLLSARKKLQRTNEQTSSVCELDIMFNLEKAHMILDEMVMKRTKVHPAFLFFFFDSKWPALLLRAVSLSGCLELLLVAIS